MAPAATQDLSPAHLELIAATKRATLLQKASVQKADKTQDEQPEIQTYIPATSNWPTQLKSDLVWNGSDYADSSLYTHCLSNTEIDELHQALEHFKGLQLSGDKINRQTFPLPSLGAKLELLAREVHSGKGFCNIRGLNPDDYSPEDNVLLYLGVASYFGERRGKQDDDGYMLAHVRDAKLSDAAQQDRPFRDSNLKLSFHTDGYTDVLAMQTRCSAAQGGNHIIASSWKIYNDLAVNRPDLLEALASSNWHFDLRGRIKEQGGRPLLFYKDGRIIMNFVRYLLVGLPNIARSAHLAPCTPKQIEALDAVEALAQKYQLILDMQPGDLTFVNNWAILHSRDAFLDDENHIRYLVRLWLKNEELAWKLPEVLDEGNQTVYYDEDLPEKWNIVPQPRLKFKIFETLGP